MRSILRRVLFVVIAGDWRVWENWIAQETRVVQAVPKVSLLAQISVLWILSCTADPNLEGGLAAPTVSMSRHS